MLDQFFFAFNTINGVKLLQKSSDMFCRKLWKSLQVKECILNKTMSTVAGTTVEDLPIISDSESRSDEFEKKRNKSKLLPRHRKLLYDEAPSRLGACFEDSIKYNRRLYGRYGKQSGVNPGIMWPTKEEIMETKEYEAIVFPCTLSETIEGIKAKRQEADLLRKAKEEDVLNRVSKLENWKKEVLNRAAKKLAEVQAAKEKKDKVVEEIRQHFGFKIDPSDERFKQMLEEKEKDEKKAARDEKRRLKEARSLARLQELNTELNQSTKPIE